MRGITTAKKLAALVPLLLIVSTSAAEEKSDVVLIVSSQDPRYIEVAAGFQSAFPGEFRKINLEGSDKKQHAFGEEIQSSRPRLAVTVGDLAAQTAKWYLDGVPVVYCESPSAARIFAPSDPVVGISHYSDPADQLKIMQSLFPDRSRVGLFYGKDYNLIDSDRIVEEARQSGLTLHVNAMGSIEDVPKKLAEEMSQADILWLLTDPEVLSRHSIQYIVIQSINRGLPVFCGDVALSGSGAAAALVPDPVKVGIKAAREAERIRAAGSFEHANIIYSDGDLILNKRVAGILHIEFPQQFQDQAVKIIK